MTKLVVFDIAGTTIQDDDAVNQAFLDAFKHFNLSPSQSQIDGIMGMSKPLSIKIILETLGETTPVREVHAQFLENMISHYSIDGNVKEINGATEVFRSLQEKGFKIALDTGFSRDITNIILDKTGWIIQGLVNAVISSDQVHCGRPHPYMIFKLMEGLQIKSVKDVTKVGDTAVDIQEGLNAGCGTVIGVTSGTYTRVQLQKERGNFFIVPNVTHVPLILESLNHG